MKITQQIKPYKGYLHFPRALLLVFKIESLDFGLLGAFIAFSTECDWDRHHDTYGCLTKPDEYLARKWGCNLTTVWRKKQQLLKRGCFEITKQGYYKLNYIEWFEPLIAKQLAKLALSTSQELIAKTQEIIANTNWNIADVQTTPSQNTDKSFKFPFKGNISVGLKEDNSGLTDEDKEWINENIKEEENTY